MAITYIQKGSSSKVDISTFGIILKSIPDIKLDAKDTFVRSWPEQQGDEEYRSATATFKAYEDSIEFACNATLNSASGLVRAFISYLAGADFSIYDDFKKRGFRCRFAGYDPVAYYKQGTDMLVFNIKVKINNPLSYAVSSISSAASAMTVYFDDGTSAIYTEGTSISKTPAVFAIVSPSKL